MAALPLLACLLAPPAGTAPVESIPDLLEAMREGAPAAEPAFARLVSRADDWRDLRTQDRTIPAADALRELARGGGPFADRAAAALAARREAILADLRAKGVRWNLGWPSRLSRGGESPEAYRIRGGEPPDEPHPIVRLRLLETPDDPVFVLGAYGGQNLTAAHLADIAAVPNLTALTLSNPTGFADAWLEPLRAHPTLRDFELTRVPLTAAGCALLATLPKLEGVDLARCPVGDAGLRELAAAPALRTLDLDRTGVTDDGLRALADGLGEGRALNRISLAGNPGVTDAGLTVLPLSDLEALDLSGTGCGDASLEHARDRWAAPGEGTTSPFGTRIGLEDTAVTDAGLAALASVPKIWDLDLEGTAVTGRGLGTFAAAGRPLPHGLHLARTGFDDAGCTLVAAAPLDQMHGFLIDCAGCPVTSAGLARLGTLRELRSLIVGGPAVTDATLASLTGCPNLAYVVIQDGPATGTGFTPPGRFEAIESLTFWNDAATDEGVRVAAALPALRHLTADGGHLTDAVWEPLAGSRSLKEVRFYHLPVAGPGLAAFARRRGPRPLLRETESLPLWLALARVGWGHESLGGWRALRTDLTAAAGRQFLLTPRWAALWALCAVRREVPRRGPPAFELTLGDVGLTDDLLQSLPVLPIGELRLSEDPVTADGVIAFIARQPHLRRVYVWDCPAAAGDGPARIAAALAGR